MVQMDFKKVLLSNQTERVPSNIEAKEHRYYSFGSVNNTNRIHYSFNHRWWSKSQIKAW